jgi:enolase
VQAIEAAGYQAGKDLFIALDPAASEFCKNGVYRLEAEAKPEKSAEEMIDFHASWCDRYPLISIEGGQAEDDWSG